MIGSKILETKVTAEITETELDEFPVNDIEARILQSIRSPKMSVLL